MKKIIFIVYCILILGLLTWVEYKTLPLLKSDFSFEKLATAVTASPLQYSVTDPSQATSMYRGNAARWGRVDISSQDEFLPFSLKWQVKNLNNGIHRASKSSPAVDDEGFYVADDTGFVRAYDWQGQLKWQFVSAVATRGLHSTPLVDKDSIYFGDYAGFIYCLNKHDGSIRWITKAGMTIGSSPLLHDGVLYVGVELNGPDGFLLALNAKNGAWLWNSNLIGNHPHSSPALDDSNNLIFMGSNTGFLQAFDLKNGKHFWDFASKDDIKCSPLVMNESVYFSSWDGFIYSVKAKSGKLNWKTALDGGSMSCPSISRDGKTVAITGAKQNFVLDADTGKIQWISNIENIANRAQSSPLILSYEKKETVVFLCENQGLCFYDLQSGKLQQMIKLTGTFSSSPVYHKGHLFLATSGADGLLVLTQESN
ncbi:outer membrane protein assembly factor BamB family protein [Bdellovibrio reynosensis]|uniref:PQQ-binding-like beta-propeller repeat protein n=1 Tax=Bdellovibrio reynosensis TaxID=2835041 RepID=A0ABY4CC44_9BACT|nr:PQQ-binding-like beta-propeller repeat protein [Bdellovibrio reynosensis]UOF02475.1 PQQ-binding-like beta-propeller repeat protein [Bdellovibrio reynosensis]